MKELFVCRAYRPRAWVAAAFSSRTPVRTLKFRMRLLSVSSSSSDETLPIPLSRSSLSPSESAGSNAVPSSKLQEANASGTIRDKYFTTQRQEEKNTQQFRVFHSKQNHCQPFRLIPTSQKHRVDSKIGICKNTSSSCSPKLQNLNTTRSEKRSKNFHYRSQSLFQNLCNVAEEPMAVFSQFTKV